jgi:nucleotide-binding universal stress UspA family protein
LSNEEVVLVGTDFSALAAQALEEGRRLAARLGLVIELLHVREGLRRNGTWTPEPAQEQWLRAAGIPTEAVVVRSGIPWLEIVRYTHERPTGMVVVGTHGSTGFQPVALGGTAARLAIMSPRPVVLIGPKALNGGLGGGR